MGTGTCDKLISEYFLDFDVNCNVAQRYASYLACCCALGLTPEQKFILSIFDRVPNPFFFPFRVRNWTHSISAALSYARLTRVESRVERERGRIGCLNDIQLFTGQLASRRIRVALHITWQMFGAGDIRLQSYRIAIFLLLDAKQILMAPKRIGFRVEP